MKHSAITLILCSSAFVTGLAAASPIKIADVTGSWVNVTPGAPVVSGLNTDTIKWGNSNPDYQSGYAFLGNAAPAFHATEGEEFSLGEFMHFNHPIGGTPLTSAELKVTAMVNLDGVSQILESIFQFDHWETVNGPAAGETCANGESRESTINQYGCADRVTLALNESSSSYYAIGSKKYYLDITGFFQDGELAHELWTQERTTSTSLLSGIIRSSALEVPEPSSFALVALSLLGFFSRKMWRRG
ncbi:THxN family PEP-CTERM protein [Marinobacter sp. M216]|uniref:THxN family PEP-CTERM protein n=1 Tax=Marinobacter albus TaxID=3030833 RepID=A0ABT7HBE9_9GAMM|nr:MULTISPECIES: THxN family PEP-CTERM protein [unclassified Marinobacter]MBW7470078.1 PEP-CTERM sorting domain-containing protein [Marinobacter sp. F4218]MDK9557658.1 THxN family PEP-CTERM protein [Marinobacter sp. M216]